MRITATLGLRAFIPGKCASPRAASLLALQLLPTRSGVSVDSRSEQETRELVPTFLEMPELPRPACPQSQLKFFSQGSAPGRLLEGSGICPRRRCPGWGSNPELGSRPCWPRVLAVPPGRARGPCAQLPRARGRATSPWVPIGREGAEKQEQIDTQRLGVPEAPGPPAGLGTRPVALPAARPVWRTLQKHFLPAQSCWHGGGRWDCGHSHAADSGPAG